MRPAKRIPFSPSRLLLLTLALPLLLSLSTGQAQGIPEASESRIKAAFLYKFCGYVEWPADAFATPHSPLVIGVANAEGIAAELEAAVIGRTLQGRLVQVRRVDPGADLAGLHLLFVGADREWRQQRLLAQARGRSVLTVTDSEMGLDSGGVINFAVTEDRVRFDISLESARHQGLRLSSQLLSVARKVRQERP